MTVERLDAEKAVERINKIEVKTMENEANDGTIPWTVDQLFGTREKLPDCEWYATLVLAPVHPWLIVEATRIEVRTYSDKSTPELILYQALDKANTCVFKGLERVMLYEWQPEHPRFDGRGLAGLFG